MKPNDDRQPSCRDGTVDPWVFEATSPHAHAIARRYCLGDAERPPCPVQDWCHSEFLEARDAANAAGGPDGTWAGVLYHDGEPKPLSRRGPQPKALHGTESGHKRHRREGADPCTACCKAHSKANGRRKAERREVAIS